MNYNRSVLIGSLCPFHPTPHRNFSLKISKHFAEVSKNMNIHDRHGLFDILQRGAIVHHIKLPYSKSSISLYYFVTVRSGG